PAHRHALHAAHACVLRLFQVALPAGLTATREAAKTKVEEKPGGGGGKGGKGGKGGGKEKEELTSMIGFAGADRAAKSVIEPQKEKPKRKGGLDFVPQTTEDWATYDVPDELLEVFRRQDLMPAAGLGRHNIAKPTITLYYCRLLTEKLRNSGLSHLSLPVLALQDCLTRDLCKSRPANCLVHLTAMDVCLELNLYKGVEFHEFCAGEIAPGVDELTENRKMLVQWRERRAQVRREEARARETLAELARELGRDPAELTAAAGAVHGGGGDAEDDSLAGGHLGEQLGELQLHTQWLEMARLLTEQAQYQTARLLLREVQLTASEIGDRRCLAGALQELGRLALREKQFGQAAQCVRQAQAMMQGWASEEDWFLSCQLLIEATAGDYTKKDALSRAKTEALRSIAVFEELGRQRSNKASLIDFLVGRLELLFGRLQIAWALDRLSQRLCSRGRAHRWLEVARRFLHCGLERLTNGRDFRHALECFQQLGTCQMEMSRLASDEEGKKQLLVDAASCFRAATRYAEAFVADAQTSGPPGDLRKFCPPAHRLAAAAKQSLADCLLQLLEIQVDEERTQAERQLAKSADTKAVEEFVQETPRLTESQSAWMSKVRLAFDLAVGQLQDAHSLSSPGGPLPTRARSLALIGRALRLLASRLDPDSPAQWRLLDIDPSAWPAGDSGDTAAAAAAGTDAEVAEEAGEDKDSSATSVKTPPLVAAAAREREAKAARRTRQAWTAFQRSRDRLAQATEVLQQAQTVALHKDALDVASQASQELLECIGQFDLSIAWQQLTLHQSCETAKQLRRTLRLALRDSNLSETAALINQLDNLEAEAAFCNGLQSRVAAAARDTLRRTSLAWRQSCVDHAHQDIGKSLPPFLGFLALQHSPDCRYLYAGAMERQRAAKPGKGELELLVCWRPLVLAPLVLAPLVLAPLSAAGAAGHPLQSRSFVLRRDTSKERLERLLDEVRDFKSEVGTLVLKHEYQRSQAAKQKRMLEAITAGVDGERSGSANHLTEEHKADLELLQTWFARLVADTAEYIGPRCTDSSGSTDPARQPHTSRREQQQQQQPDDCLVLLIDPNMAELPLEALQQLHFDSLSGMSRDFSLQLVARRLFGSKHLLDEDGGAGGGTGDDEEDDDQRAAAVGGGGGGGAGGKAGKDKASKAISRIPGLRDASKKQSKIIPLVSGAA
uniref:TPR_REGION domain-containing protein n=1 Tax=Macrostomum lignano TaxID=282301 RepID=A0A1I8ITK5_9PLAT